MSLSTSISNAFSGLTVTAHAAQLVSSNLSNALNEDYSRRELEVTSHHQGGAKFVKTNRFVDHALNSDLRGARANLGLSNSRTESAIAIEQSVGLPDNPNSLTAHLSRFDVSLRYLESDPSSGVRLQETFSTAVALTNKFGAIESDIQKVRQRTDTQIATTVTALNSKLQQIVTLNREITAAQINGHETSTWLDQRKSLVDEVSEIVPVREIRQDHNSISLVSANGMMLLEANAVQFNFIKTNVIMPHMTIDSGDLGSLRIGTRSVDLSSESGPLSGGRLQGLFETRDKLTVDAQHDIDALAFNLADRFHDLPSDMTIGASSPGLFTDGTARAEIGNVRGLAGRLNANINVDPSHGGKIWRLRSGLQAPAESAVGDASLVKDMISALTEANQNGSLLEKTAGFVSSLAQSVSESKRINTFSKAHFEQLNTLHLGNGVNTDAELQKLMQIETNYAANAKVMQTIDEMFAAILRIN